MKFLALAVGAVVALLPGLVPAQDYVDCVSNADCNNHGSCAPRTGTCQCDPAWTGRFCMTSACARRPCQGNTICVGPNQCRNINSVNDRGRPDFSYYDGGSPGTGRADNALCTRNCVNGRCVANNECQCLPGYVGDDCSARLSTRCQNRCNNRGRCLDYGAGPVCECDQGYSGDDCGLSDNYYDNYYNDLYGNNNPNYGNYGADNSVSASVCKPGCDNGNCVNGRCQCQAGYSGEMCDDWIGLPSGEGIGGQCNTDGDCTSASANAVCQRVTASCTTGRCACQTGFLVIGGKCRRPSEAGDSCDGTTTACVHHSSCSNGVCQCDRGFVTGPLGICAAASARSGRGEQCSSSDECYYDLVCNSGTCGCSPGRLPATQYACRKAVYGDSCGTNADCRHLPRAECASANRTCSCGPGYYLWDYTDERGASKKICARGSPIRPSRNCQLNIDVVCATDYACIACSTPSTAACYWPLAKGTPPTARPQQAPVTTTRPIVSSSAVRTLPGLFSTGFLVAVAAGLFACC